jgi:hypothetical protein
MREIMQPNQQDPNQIQSTQQPYSNVPDYLQLNTPQPAPKKSMAKPVIFMFIILFIVAGLGTATFTWFQGAPERRFYDALDKAMQTSFITRRYELTTTDSNSNSVNVSGVADTDCSLIGQCKSKLTYSYSSTSNSTKVKDEKTVINGEEVITNNDNYFARATSVIPQPTPAITLNQWYTVKEQSGAGFHNRFGLNAYKGLILFGNFSTDQRSQLMSLIQSKDVYTIKSIQDGPSTTVYNIATDSQKINDLSNNALILIKDKSKSLQISDSILNFSLSIDNKTNRIIEMVLAPQLGLSGEKIFYSYPSGLSIQEPTNTKAATQG